MTTATTYGAALAWAARRIAPVSSSAGLDAQLLLMAVTGDDRAHVIAHPEKALAPEQAARYAALVNRRAAGEPIAYILGRRAFYDREFAVTPAVLIPRPETEHLLEAALALVHEQPGCRVVDVGTGSGALAITLAAHAPGAQVWATDISPAALAVARRNAAAHNQPVTFLEGDLLLPLIERGLRVDGVLANLPYIPTADMQQLEVSRYEPHLALDGGPDGLDLFRRLLDQLPQVCGPSAWLLLEIGAAQGPAVAGLVRERVPAAQVDVLPDYAGHDRVVRARWH